MQAGKPNKGAPINSEIYNKVRLQNGDYGFVNFGKILSVKSNFLENPKLIGPLELSIPLVPYKKAKKITDNHFPKNTSPIEIFSFKINQIYPNTLPEHELVDLRKVLNKHTDKSEVFYGNLYSTILFICTNNADFMNFIRLSIDAIHRSLYEKKHTFRKGYDLYWKKNLESMLENKTLYIDNRTEKLVFNSVTPATPFRKALRLYAYAMTCFYKEEKMEFELFGAALAYLDVDRLASKTERVRKSLSGYDRFYQEAHTNKNNDGQIDTKIVETMKVLEGITKNTNIHDTEFFSQSLIGGAFSSNVRYGAFCDYISNVFLLFMANNNAPMDGRDKILKIEEFKVLLNNLSTMLLHSPAELSYLIELLERLNIQQQDTVASTIIGVFYVKYYNDINKMLSYLEENKLPTKLIIHSIQKELDICHVVTLIPIDLNGKRIYCYFDPNLGISYVYNLECIEMHIRTTINEMTNFKGSKSINLNDFKFSALDFNDATLRRLINSFAYSEYNHESFLKVLQKKCLSGWKLKYNKLINHEEWDLLFCDTKDNDLNSEMMNIDKSKSNNKFDFIQWFNLWKEITLSE